MVNWFKKNHEGKFIWPGYSQNMRVLKWIFQRTNKSVGSKETFMGYQPRYEDMDWAGLEMTSEKFTELQKIQPSQWETELLSHKEFFQKLGHFPLVFLGIQETAMSKMKRENLTLV